MGNAKRGYIVWSIRELCQLMRKRQLNKFDANLGVSGMRGNGKSTLLYHIFNTFRGDGFKPFTHQVYAQDDVIKLLKNQKLGFCWDDEAINSGYKRDFHKAGQTELIKIVTNYRDNYNLYGSALPFFYSLDKALRELIFMHVHIIERGVGVVLLPLEGQIHSQDPWDTITNKKIEAKENARLERNTSTQFHYSKFTTFAGYVYFGPMTPRQEERYMRVKHKKRGQQYDDKLKEAKPKTTVEKLYDYLMLGKLNQQVLQHTCLMEGLKYSNIATALNTMLRDKGAGKTLTQALQVSENELKKTNPQIINLIPET